MADEVISHLSVHALTDIDNSTVNKSPRSLKIDLFSKRLGHDGQHSSMAIAKLRLRAPLRRMLLVRNIVESGSIPSADSQGADSALFRAASAEHK